MFLALLPSRKSAQSLYEQTKELRDELKTIYVGFRENKPENYGFGIMGGEFTDEQLRAAHDFVSKPKEFELNCKHELFRADTEKGGYSVGIVIKKTVGLAHALSKMGQHGSSFEVYITLGEVTSSAVYGYIESNSVFKVRTDGLKIEMDTAHYERFGASGANDPPISGRKNEFPVFQ